MREKKKKKREERENADTEFSGNAESKPTLYLPQCLNSSNINEFTYIEGVFY